ncbi:hypothetical protein [Haladaptatus caseinilyticus]|uniref:hypothetical protein n=1 Tax=Haladaptatus caseinilyticus TaxID=2993314 RepID=UPI00224B2EC3|nr:hypothetical protein [Haladaptatus caseinilyticus]
MTNESNDSTRAMADVSHVHPYADQGAMTRLFNRGPTVADGGVTEDVTDETEPDTMAEVSHSPPEGAGDSATVFERGYEHRVRET